MRECHFGLAEVLFSCAILEDKTSANHQPIRVVSALGPIVELQEVGLEDLWGGLEDQQGYEEPGEGLFYSQAEISERDVSAREAAADDRAGSDGMSIIDRGRLEQMDVSETETGGIPTEENQAAESGGAEVRRGGGKHSFLTR